MQSVSVGTLRSVCVCSCNEELSVADKPITLTGSSVSRLWYNTKYNHPDTTDDGEGSPESPFLIE